MPPPFATSPAGFASTGSSTGAEQQLAALAAKVADVSYGWPQHLRAAMQVAAGELASWRGPTATWRL